jgi:hypothetical protein
LRKRQPRNQAENKRFWDWEIKMIKFSIFWDKHIVTIAIVMLIVALGVSGYITYHALTQPTSHGADTIEVIRDGNIVSVENAEYALLEEDQLDILYITIGSYRWTYMKSQIGNVLVYGRPRVAFPKSQSVHVTVDALYDNGTMVRWVDVVK